MQDRTDAVQVRCKKGQIKYRADAGQNRCRTGGMKYRTASVQVRCRRVWMQDSMCTNERKSICSLNN